MQIKKVKKGSGAKNRRFVHTRNIRFKKEVLYAKPEWCFLPSRVGQAPHGAIPP